MTSGSNYVDATQDPASTYYLHPSDQANNKLVTTTFNGSNFGKWKRSMTLTLSAKNKMGFVDGSLPKSSADPKDEKAWERCNNIVIGWILSSLDDSISQSVFYHKLAQEIWTELEERYGTPSSAHLYSLQEKLFNLEHTAGMSVAEFFTQVKTIWDEMDNLINIPTCECCASCKLSQKVLKAQTDQRILHFLMKIDDKFEHVRSNILMMSELPGVSQVYRILQQEETHKQLSKQYNSGPAEPSAFFSSKRDFRTNIESSSSKGYSKYNKSHTNGIKRTLFCDHCKNTGHTISKCYKLHGYPNQNKGQKSNAFACADEASTLPPGMTEDQFSRFLSFMAQEKAETSQETIVHHAELASSSNFAGPFDEKAYASW